jgi:hypothetical protein
MGSTPATPMPRSDDKRRFQTSEYSTEGRRAAAVTTARASSCGLTSIKGADTGE